MKLKKEHIASVDTRGRIHFNSDLGDPICGQQVAEDDDDGNSMTNLKTKEVTCTECVQFIKQIKAL